MSKRLRLRLLQTTLVLKSKHGKNRLKVGINAMSTPLFQKYGQSEICIRDANRAFVLVRTDSFSLIIDVDIGEAFGLL